MGECPPPEYQNHEGWRGAPPERPPWTCPHISISGGPPREAPLDTNQVALHKDQPRSDPLIVPKGPITRAKTRRIREAMQGLVNKVVAEPSLYEDSYIHGQIGKGKTIDCILIQVCTEKNEVPSFEGITPRVHPAFSKRTALQAACRPRDFLDKVGRVAALRSGRIRCFSRLRKSQFSWYFQSHCNP